MKGEGYMRIFLDDRRPSTEKCIHHCVRAHEESTFFQHSFRAITYICPDALGRMKKRKNGVKHVKIQIPHVYGVSKMWVFAEQNSPKTSVSLNSLQAKR